MSYYKRRADGFEAQLKSSLSELETLKDQMARLNAKLRLSSSENKNLRAENFVLEESLTTAKRKLNEISR